MFIAYFLFSLLICDRFVASVELNSNPGIQPEAEALTGQELVDYINRNQNLWKARLNDKFTLSGKNFKGNSLGHSPRDYSGRIAQNMIDQTNITLPMSFDAREKWPYCQSIWRIDDQSSCGSCWAIAAVMTMSDRICIASEGEIQVSLSVMDLVTCCANCSVNKEKGGCFGGNPERAWQFWSTNGLVTGSDYTSQMGCRPYSFPHCERGVNSSHYPQCKEFDESYPTPSCETKCQDNYKENSFAADKHYGYPPFVIANDSVAIQRELYTNGPLEVGLDVYEDFEYYTSGIYKHVAGKYRYGHEVRLIGWGEENGTLFWILANTFNSDWGDHGFFRIVRGSNECNIEEAAVGAFPDLKRYQASAAGSCRPWITVLTLLTVLTHYIRFRFQKCKI